MDAQKISDAVNIPGSPYRGSAQITREQFMFQETRITARLLLEGIPESEVISRIYRSNLFQYPTEKSLKHTARSCLARIHALNDDSLITTIAEGGIVSAKQVCLYAMMKRYSLVRDFMLDVIGTKYQQQDYSFSRRDINIFMLHAQEQDTSAASWADSTVRKICSVLMRILTENGYTDTINATELSPVMICPALEDSIRRSGSAYMLPAFNCLQ